MRFAGAIDARRPISPSGSSAYWHQEDTEDSRQRRPITAVLFTSPMCFSGRKRGIIATRLGMSSVLISALNNRCRPQTELGERTARHRIEQQGTERHGGGEQQAVQQVAHASAQKSSR